MSTPWFRCPLLINILLPDEESRSQVASTPTTTWENGGLNLRLLTSMSRLSVSWIWVLHRLLYRSNPTNKRFIFDIVSFVRAHSRHSSTAATIGFVSLTPLSPPLQPPRGNPFNKPSLANALLIRVSVTAGLSC